MIEIIFIGVLAMAAPTYTKDIRPIVMNRCTPCHTGQVQGLPNFSKYEVAFKKRDKIMLRVVTQKSMPPGNFTNITDKERNLIKQWIDAGAKK